MLSSKYASLIYGIASIASFAWALVGFYVQLPPAYLIFELALTVVMLVLAIVAKERRQIALRRAERQQARAIYRERKPAAPRDPDTLTLPRSSYSVSISTLQPIPRYHKIQ